LPPPRIIRSAGIGKRATACALGATGIGLDSVIAGVAQRVERERDQPGRDDSERERPVGTVSQSSEGAVEADGIVRFVVDRRLDQEDRFETCGRQTSRCVSSSPASRRANRSLPIGSYSSSITSIGSRWSSSTELESEVRRVLTVVKMRDGNHTKNLLEVEITKSGVSVIGTFSGLTGVLGGNPTLTPAPKDEPPTLS